MSRCKLTELEGRLNISLNLLKTGNPSSRLKKDIETVLKESIAAIQNTQESKPSKELVEIRARIVDLTKQTIDGLDEKRKRNGFLSTVVRVISYLFSFIWAGGQYYAYLKKNNETFDAEIAKLKADLDRSLFNDTLKSKALELTEQVFHDLKETYKINDQTTQEHFQKQVTEKFGSRTKKNVVDQFRADIERGYQFNIYDPMGYGHSSNRLYPSQKLRKEDRVDAAVNALSQLNSPKWEIAVQSVCNQVAFTSSLIDQFIGMFLVYGMGDDNIRTQDEDRYAFLAEQSSGERPFEITVNRNQETFAIESIQFKAVKSIDIMKHNFSNDEKKLFEKEAITGNVSYTLKLDNENKPIIQDFRFTHTVNFN